MEPKSPLAYGALGALLLNEGKRTDAERVFTQAKEAIPDVSEGYRMLGDFYFAVGDLPHALDEYASLSKQHPKDERQQKNYIQLLILSSRLDEAIKLNDRLLKDHAEDLDGLIMRGQILNAQGHLTDAVQTLQSAAKEDPNNPAAHYSLGVALASLGDTGRAAGELQEAARLQPKMIQTYRALGALALRNGDMSLLLQSAGGLYCSATPFP